MVSNWKVKSLIFLALSAVLLSACTGGGTPVPPTIDPNVIYTQAAQTVMAGLARTPSATPAATRTNTPPAAVTGAPGTGTPATTATRGTPVTQLTVTPGIGGVVLTPPILSSPSAAGTALVPTNTPAPKVVTGDKCTYEGQNPADGSVIAVNQQFPMTWTIRNTGSTTWNSTYQVKFFGGNKMGGPEDYDIPRDIKPNEPVNITFYLYGPEASGKVTSGWALLNNNGTAFCFFDVTVEVK
jgi:hypothetical protein